MTEPCAICDTRPGRTEATVLNDSGGVPVSLCEECRTKLTARCSVCGDSLNPSRSEGLYFPGEESTTYPLCPSCRYDIVFGDGGEFR